jgi:hypothetical protein
MMMFRLPAVTNRHIVFPPLMGFSAVMIVAAAPVSVLGSSLAVGIAGALIVLGARPVLGLVAGGLLLWGMFRPLQDFGPYGWLTALAYAAAALIPTRSPIILSSMAPSLWAAITAIGSVCLALAMHISRPFAFLAGSVAIVAALALGVVLARYNVRPKVRVVAGGADSLASMARDLLLGRIASGMLHDLSQPLNVISMANGNLGYIIERLDIAGERREQMIERTQRIAIHTDKAAQVLSLFRWFGRDGSRDQGRMTVGSALERAVAATRSDHRHGVVKVQISGDALDYPVLLRHGTVEMLVVAALLSAFSAFKGVEASHIAGSITLHASQTADGILVMLTCLDEDGKACATGEIDREMLWLVSEAARERGGHFRRISKRDQPLCIVIGFSRATI